MSANQENIPPKRKVPWFRHHNPGTKYTYDGPRTVITPKIQVLSNVQVMPPRTISYDPRQDAVKPTQTHPRFPRTLANTVPKPIVKSQLVIPIPETPRISRNKVPKQLLTSSKERRRTPVNKTRHSRVDTSSRPEIKRSPPRRSYRRRTPPRRSHRQRSPSRRPSRRYRSPSRYYSRRHRSPPRRTSRHYRSPSRRPSYLSKQSHTRGYERKTDRDRKIRYSPPPPRSPSPTTRTVIVRPEPTIQWRKPPVIELQPVEPLRRSSIKYPHELTNKPWTVNPLELPVYERPRFYDTTGRDPRSREMKVIITIPPPDVPIRRPGTPPTPRISPVPMPISPLLSTPPKRRWIITYKNSGNSQ